jgi:ATP-dependent RNA helicase RhlE
MKNEDPNGVFGLLLPEIGKAVAEAGYTTPSPIQKQSIPSLLKGRDMLGCAQTGTGKTAAFMLPILNYLVSNKKQTISGKPKVLILAPTRELAAQISDSVAKYGRHTNISRTVIFGGVGQYPQVKAVRRGVHIVVATPGRLLDLMKQGHVDLSAIDIFVLDEADRMLDMGFMPDIKRVIAKLPRKRQTLFFSATMERAVVQLANTLVHDAVHVTIEPEKPAVDRITQKVFFVDKGKKDDLLVNLMEGEHLERVIIFTQMKHVANRVELKLSKEGIKCASIHGNKSQTARTKAMRDFKTGRTRALVATDIAARGIDVDGISHVINYDMPQEAETYVHRIGRTARAGADGDAISFCSARERDQLRAIETLIRFAIPRDLEHAFHCEQAMTATGVDAKPLPRGGNSRGRSGGGGRGGQGSSSRGKGGAPGGHSRAGKRPSRGGGRKRSNPSHSNKG